MTRMRLVPPDRRNTARDWLRFLLTPVQILAITALPAALAFALATALAAGAALAAAPAAAAPAGGATDDPLAADVAHWTSLLHGRAATGPGWAAAEQAARPGLAGVTAALADGRRLVALFRLATVRVQIASMVYRAERPAAESRDLDALTGEWKRMGTVLHADLGPPAAGTLAGVRPALARAIGEAALPQVREWYQASLDYGRATAPEEGLFYLSDAVGQEQLVAFSRTLGGAFPQLEPPPLRPLDAELDSLDAAVQAAFRPPASIEHHADFVGTSELLKEARELNAAGLLHGALLRYLQAALAFGPLRPAPPPGGLDAAALARRLAEIDRRLSPSAAERTDHTIGRLFLEIAQAHLAARSAPGNAAIAAALAGDVLPRYLAALAPARGAPPPAAPAGVAAVTVTLVRWPYT
jgi:hypothetical protein